MLEPCPEQVRLRKIYENLFDAWIDAGGIDEQGHEPPQRPYLLELKQAVKDAVADLVKHRKEHGC